MRDEEESRRTVPPLQLSPVDAVAPVHDANVLQAELRDLAFLGDRYRYELTCGGIDLLAQGGHAMQRGTVGVVIPPDACVVLSGAAGQRDQSPAPMASMVA